MTTDVVEDLQSRRVRVWFCMTAIADQVAEPVLATHYEQAMRRRFAGLRVTNEPVTKATEAIGEPR